MFTFMGYTFGINIRLQLLSEESIANPGLHLVHVPTASGHVTQFVASVHAGSRHKNILL